MKVTCVRITDDKEYPVVVQIGPDGYKMTIDAALTLHSQLSLVVEQSINKLMHND